ncbi:MAG: kelch repeat-containing protein [Planctomycetota bacterium]
MTTFAHPVAFALACTAALAQAPFQGNNGRAYLGHTMVRIGSTFEALFGSPVAPSSLAVLALSDGLGPTVDPLVGTVGLDLLSPALSVLTFGLDAGGACSFSAAIPNTPALVQTPPLFAVVAVLEPGGIGISKTTRLDFENADSYAVSGSMALARAGHTVTALGEGPFDKEIRVLIAGGGGGSILVPQASAATEVYSPLLRTTSPGPSMSVPRALHAAARLPDGRVLLCGGTDSGGNVTSTVDLYDPRTNQITPGVAMRLPRAGHAATLLPNGRVLVTGGLANYVNPLGNLAAVLNTAQDTGEIYDPIAGTWTSVPGTMNSRRSGHTQTLLQDGRVMIIGGIQGGTTTSLGIQIPVYTAFTAFYGTLTNSFSAGPPMLESRAFHGASVLGSGDVLVSGGSIANPLFGLVGATDTCERYNGVSFQGAAPLAVPVTNHVQLQADNGHALMFGGLTGLFPTLTGSAMAGSHDGVTFTRGRDVGLNPGIAGSVALPRGAMVGVRLFDRSIGLFGGTDGVGPLASTLIYRR